MSLPDYKQSWQRRLWQFFDAVSVNLTSNDLSVAVTDDRTRKVRQGEVYHFSHIFSSILDGENGDILITTGSNRITLTLASTFGAQSELRFYEDTVATDDGTLVLSANRNRQNSTNNFTSSIYYAPTVSDTGTLLTEDFFPAGIKNKEIGSSSEQTSIWILKPNTKYLVRVTNTSGGAEEAQVSGDIFEDTV